MIKTQNLTKHYDGLVAVDDLTFSVEPGEVLGFLGPNGAGKSTTMRMIAGFITPTAGSASICGHDVGTEPLAAKAALGYLPEGAPMYAEMTVGGFLDFIADLRSLEGAAPQVPPRLRHRPAAARARDRAVDRDAVEGLQAARRPRAGDRARSEGADPRRAHRRPRSAAEKRSARAHRRDRPRKDHRDLDAHPRRSRRGLHARDHHRARQAGRRRDARGAQARAPSGRLEDVFRAVAA